MKKTILLLIFLSILTIWDCCAQNKPPVAKNDSFYNRISGNVIRNDGDPNNDVLKVLHYFVDGVQYEPTTNATGNIKLKAKYGTVYVQINGGVYSDTNITIRYIVTDGHKLSNGRYVVDTATCVFSSKWAKKPGPIVNNADSILLKSALGVMIYPKPYSGNCTFPYTKYYIEMRYRDTIVWRGAAEKGIEQQGTNTYPVYYIWCTSSRGEVTYRISESEFNLIASKGCKP